MDREEIEEFLIDWDVAPIRNNIDMIERLYTDAYEKGHDEGYLEGQDSLAWQQQTERNRGGSE